MKQNSIFVEETETQHINIKIPEETSNSHQIKLDNNTTRKHTEKNSSALEETYGSIVKFPFKWKYGRIKELSDTEKAGFNRIKHRGRRQYQKPCALCGEEGVIEFKKVSNGNPSFICESCAKQYVLSAIRLMEKGIA